MVDSVQMAIDSREVDKVASIEDYKDMLPALVSNLECLNKVANECQSILQDAFPYIQRIMKE